MTTDTAPVTAGLTAQQLYEAAPLGARVTFWDGKPKPPARHKNKLRDWESNNSENNHTFRGCRPAVTLADNKGYVAPASFTMTRNYGVGGRGIGLVVNTMFNVTRDELLFTYIPPVPGTILAYVDRDGRVEVEHLWPTLADAHAWQTDRGARYYFSKQSRKYWLIGENGERIDYNPPDSPDLPPLDAPKKPLCPNCDGRDLTAAHNH